jgi:hypothetical protein
MFTKYYKKFGVTMNQKNLLQLSIEDLFTAKMLKFSLLPFLISMVILYILFFILAGAGLDMLGTFDVESTQTTIENGIPHTDSLSAQLQGTGIIKFLMSYSITSWIASFLVYAIGGFFTLYLSIFVAVIVMGFLTPYVLKELQVRHYSDVEMIGYSNVAESLFLVVKWAFTMILLFFLLIPLYFIPLLNIVAFNLPLYYFFHKMMTYDIASNLCTREESKEVKYFNATSLRVKTAALYLISLIPFTVFFGAIFFIIYLGNSYFVAVREIRAKKLEGSL